MIILLPIITIEPLRQRITWLGCVGSLTNVLNLSDFQITGPWALDIQFRSFW